MAAPVFRARGLGGNDANPTYLPFGGGAVVGDLAICYIFTKVASSGASAAPWTVSRGSRTWTKVADTGSGSSLRGAAYAIVLNAADIAAGTVTVTSTVATWTAVIATYNGGVGVAASSGSNTRGSSFTSYQAPTVTSLQDNVLVAEAWGVSGSTSPLTLPSSIDISQSGLDSHYPPFGVSDQSQPTPGVSTPQSASYGSSVKWAALTVLIYGTGAPLAPTLRDPSPNAYAPLDLGYTFDWDFNSDSDPATTQTAYALRRMAAGGSSYEYWNAGTASWQGTIVWNSSTSTSATFAAGKWTNGVTYQWSVATQDSLGQGIFAPDSLVNVSDPPAVTIASPATSSVVTNQFTVSWTETLQALANQTSYRVVVESGAFGTSPGSGTTQYDSGVVSSLALSDNVLADFPNNTAHRIFVQISQTGGQLSPWAYVDVTVKYEAPASPSLGVTWDPDNARAVITVLDRDNLLTADESSFEAGYGRWQPTRATVATTAAWASDQTHSLAVTGSGASGSTAEIYMGASGGLATPFPVNPGDQVTGMVDFHAATTSRSVGARLGWYNSTGTLLSSTTATLPADGTVVVQGIAPAGAACVGLVPFITHPADGEIHYLDRVSLAFGASTDWTIGGFAGAGTYTLQASEDGGATWHLVRGVIGLTSYDYERTPDAVVIYRARETEGLVSSPYGPSSSPIYTEQTSWWIKDVLEPSLNMALCDAQQNIRTRQGDSVAVYPAGRTNPVVLRGPVHGANGNFRTIVKTEADRLSALELYTAQGPMLLQDPRGRQWYVEWVGDITETPFQVGQPFYSLERGWVEVDVPS